MSADRLPPLDRGLDTLLAAERALPVDPAAKVRVLARVEATLALPPAGGVTAPVAASGAGKLALLVGALVVGVGAIVFVTTRPSETPPPVRAELPFQAPLPEPAAAPIRPVLPVVAQPPAPPAPVPAAAPPAPRPPRVSDEGDLAAERALVESARQAMIGGHPLDALSLLGKHQRRFLHGRLVEEREVLAIQSMARTGDLDGARTRAARFRTRFPNSIQRAVIDATVGK